MRFLISMLLMLFVHSVQAQTGLKQQYDAGIAAYQAGDHAGFLQHMLKANEMRPNHPTITYKLAAAHALNNQQHAALAVMQQIILMNAEVKFDQDPDFAAVLGSEKMPGLKALSQQLQQPINNSQIIKKVELGQLHPEGIAYLASENQWLVGGVHQRKVVQISGQGLVTDWVSYQQHPDMYAVMAIAVDEARGIIWLCSAALPQMTGYSDELKGHSSVMAFDFEGKLKHSEKSVGDHVFGDLVLRKDGSVLISDSGENQIFRTSVGGQIKPWVDLSNRVLNLQGIALAEQESVLYFSDYLTGLYRLNMADFAYEKINLGTHISDKGFDGLKYHNGTLLAIQNGVSPQKTWHLTLAEGGTQITASQVLDQALDYLDEPTQGLIHDDAFIYIANSPWGRYKNGQLVLPADAKTIFLSYPLQ